MHLRSLVLVLTFTMLPLCGEDLQPLSPAHLGALRKSHLPPAADCVTVPLISTFAGFTLESRIDGKPVQLLLDTGAACSILSTGMARKMGLVIPERSEEVEGATGGKVAVRRALTKSIRLGEAWTANEPIFISDLPGGIDGLLGVSTLADWDVRIDPSKKELTLFPVGKAPSLEGETTLPLSCGVPNPVQQSATGQGFRKMIFSVPVRMGGHEFPALPDTGFNGNLVLPIAFMEKAAPGAMKDAAPALFAGVTISGQAVSRTATLPEFTFGPDTLRDFTTEVMEFPPSAMLERNGLLGLNLLRHYVMTFRFAAAELRLKPLGTVQEITQASTAGMTFSQDFRIVDVLPDGPAAKAGLLEGYELLEFNGQPLRTMRFEDFTALKRLPPGTVLKVRFRRGESNPAGTNLVLEIRK